MKVEIKKVHILSVLFSVFPLAVFVALLFSSMAEIFDPDVTFTLYNVVGMLVRAVIETILVMLSAVFFLCTYNFLRKLGIRGVQIDLEDK